MFKVTSTLKGPIALVLEPTRELAVQTYHVPWAMGVGDELGGLGVGWPCMATSWRWLKPHFDKDVSDGLKLKKLPPTR